MHTLSRQSYALGAIVFLVGCTEDLGVAPDQGQSNSRGGSAASSEKSTSTSKGGSANSSQKTGSGGKTASTDAEGGSTSEEGSGNAGGRDDVGEGGSSASPKGGSRATTTKGGSGAVSSKTGSSAVASGGKTGNTIVTATGGVLSSKTSTKSTDASGGVGTGGTKATGGTGTGGGATTTAASTGAVDCNAPMPTGGTLHSGNGQGGKDNLAWQIWSNVGTGDLTTFDVPAFIATWNNSGDYLGRLGYEWGNNGKTFDAYGEIGIDYVFKKTGTGGPYSYVGVYGWSTNPCIEWYIVEDSFSAMPFNTGDPVSGTADIDGGTYNLVTRNTTGTGGNRCGNVSNWDQFYSIRKKGSQCGHISVSEHFRAWDAKGWKLGKLLEVKILVEAGGGSGSVEFPLAKVSVTTP